MPGEPTCTRGLELLVLSTPPPISGEGREAGGQIQRPKANGLINYSYVKNPPLVAQMVKRLPTMRETQVQSLGWEDPLEKEMATLSSSLAWKIPWTEEPGRLQSMGSQRVGQD